jgi:hypothetical protein
MEKVFRVWITEECGFYADVEALNEVQAMHKVRAGLDDASIHPMEDNAGNTGFVVKDAEEISREDAQLV